MTIYPTHTCFDDVLDYIELLVRSGERHRLPGMRVVHGICLAPEGARAGEPYAHGWIEEDGLVVQGGLVDVDGTREKVYYGVDRAEFYAKLRVQVTTVYSVEEAVRKNWETGYYGPWESTYLALVGHGERTLFQ